MNIVDVESMEADQVIDLLLTGGALHDLVGEHAAACFALPGPLHAQAFYEALIQHTANIDVTTRQHVAFILFYENASTTFRHSNAGYTQMWGLSTSTDSTKLSFMNRRTREEVFSERFGEHFRYRPQDIDRARFSQVMTNCTRALLDRFTLSHSVEPCVLFVDPVRPKKHFTVTLDKGDPVRSLFNDLLNPLSDAFRLLLSSRPQTEQLERVLQEHQKAHNQIEQRARLVAEIRKLELRVAHVEAEARSATWTALREAFHGDWKNADHILSDTGIEGLVRGDEVRAIKETRQRCAQLTQKLEALSTEAGSDALEAERRRLRIAIANTANWRVNKLAALRAKLQKRPEFDEGCRRALHAHLARARDELPKKEEEARGAEERLVQLEASRREKQAQVDIQQEKLQRFGLNLDMLQARAFSVIEAMQKAGSIGAKTQREPGGHRVRVLILAANPHVYSQPVDLERELRDVKEVFRRVRHRDDVTVEVGHAVRVEDLIHLLREQQPDIVHFCGHGTPQGVQLRAEEGRDVTEVSGDALARVFQERGVKLVVLNACFSGYQASVLSKVVPCVVGTTDEVDDDDARRFSKTFFKTLGDGHTVGEAFRDGRDVVDASGGATVFCSFGNLDRVLFGPGVARGG